MHDLPSSVDLMEDRPRARGESASGADESSLQLVSEERLRRWLTLLRQPDRLAEGGDVAPLLALHGRLPSAASRVDLGRATADLLRDAINGLEPAPDAPQEQRMPYQVLRTCFLDGATRWQAANKLGLSERQMSRERTRAIRLLKAALDAPESDVMEGADYRPEPIPAILGFVPRAQHAQALRESLRDHRLVRVHGPPGVGKTSLVADFATEVSEQMPSLWYRFRAGVNDTVEALLFELGEYLRSHRRPDLAMYIDSALPALDAALATRLALKGLSGSAHFLVLDDYHVVDEELAISGLLEEAVARLPELHVVLIGRYRGGVQQPGASLAIPAFTRLETRTFLTHLGIGTDPQLAAEVHKWTEGIPQLVKLAASWLKTAMPEEVAGEMDTIGDLQEAQDFFLKSITELMGPEERVILEAASIFRHRFTDDALAFVADRTRGEIQDTSRYLVRAYVATRSRSGDVAFFHNSVRDYVYERLSPKRRAALHERAMMWYQRRDEEVGATWHRARMAEAEGL